MYSQLLNRNPVPFFFFFHFKGEKNMCYQLDRYNTNKGQEEINQFTIIATERNRAFKLSGKSDLPAYPGFIVMNTAQVGSNFNSVPSNIKVN